MTRLNLFMSRIFLVGEVKQLRPVNEHLLAASI
jgi:hypothetical protein